MKTRSTTNSPSPFALGRITFLAAALSLGMAANRSLAEDWGAYSIVPASAPLMALEAVASGTTDGTEVSIGKPAGTANQKWAIIPKGDNLYSIRPVYNSTLVLAVEKGQAKMGTQIVLETDSGQPWQLWSLTKSEGGNYILSPKSAPTMGVDDNGGKQTPGAKIDLWEARPNDQHLQWIIKPLAGSAVAAASTVAASKPYEPPVIKPEEILPGVTKEFKFTESAIFPGTERGVTVFIPAQYDGSKPACVYVKTDGYNPREKTIMEAMIATKEMPVTIGVFVRPGDLPAPMKGTMGRRNRDLEYDGMGDKNVRFLVDELLPYVAKEFNLKLSTDGNDRCVSGGSSGGIAAFTAAWERPEAFSRVYAASGSFVAFRGGNEYPTMIRKFEAKPIRAYFTTATHDMENCAGDWFILDQEMDKALKFSGYDYIFRIVDGRHVAGYMENYREAMAYLWKGWPERVKAGPSAPRAQDVLVPNEDWQLVEKQEGLVRAAACNATGEVFFADPIQNKIFTFGPDGKVKEFVSDSGGADGLSFGADGHLYTVSKRSGAIISYDPSGKGTKVAEGIPADSVLAMPDGGLYVTGGAYSEHDLEEEIISLYNRGVIFNGSIWTVPGDAHADAGTVWHVKDGKKTLVDSGLKYAAGLAYRPDQWLLSVADGRSHWAYSYKLNPDGSLTDKERYFDYYVSDGDDDAGATSVCYAQEGQMFTATRSGIQISADDGPTQVILPLPDRSRVMAVCLGGPELDTLYAFAGDKIWKRKVKTHAMGAFSPWTKVNGTKL